MFYWSNRYISLNLFVILLSESLLIFSTSLFFTGIIIDDGGIYISDHSCYKTFLITTTYLIAIYFFDLYSPEYYRPNRHMIIKLGKAILVSVIILFGIYFFFPEAAIGTFVTLAYALLLPVLLISWRAVFTEVLSVELPEKKILILGFGAQARQIGAEIFKWRGHGIDLVGYVDDDPAHTKNSELYTTIMDLKHRKQIRRESDVRVIGGFGDILEIVNTLNINKIVVALTEKRVSLPMSALLKCKMQGVRIVEGDTFLERLTGKVSVEHLKPSWLVFSEGFRELNSKKRLKRFVDILFSILGLLFLSPLIFLTCLMIRIESKGPIIYSQKRVGENGREFDIYKFRSMRVDAESATGPVWAGEQDPRITRVGRVLRKLRIDEIPQMVNTLRGDMSFVGPRPERLYFINELKQSIPFYEIRLVVKPGITGWAQIMYPYGANLQDAVEKLQYDIYYIKNMSFMFDFWIFFKTVKVVLFGQGSR